MQFWLSVRNSVEALLREIQEEISHLAGWEGGGFNGPKDCEQSCVNKLAFPNLSILPFSVKDDTTNSTKERRIHWRWYSSISSSQKLA